MRPYGGGTPFRNLGSGERAVGLAFLLIDRMISGGSLPMKIGLLVWSSFEWGLRYLRSVVLDRGNKRSLLLRIWHDWEI